MSVEELEVVKEIVSAVVTGTVAMLFIWTAFKRRNLLNIRLM